MNLLLYTEKIKSEEIKALLYTWTIPQYTMFSFIGFSELDPTSFNDYLELATEVSIEKVISRFNREEKNAKAPEKKRPWTSVKTRFPFEGKIYHGLSKKDKKQRIRRIFKLCWRIVKNHPVPDKLIPAKIKKKGGSGRPLTFHWLRIVAVIIATFYLFGSVKYAKDLIELLDIDVTISYNRKHKKSKKRPSLSEIYKIYQRMPEEYLVSILTVLDEWVRKRGLKNLGLIADVCVVDGSAERMHYKEIRLIKGKERLSNSTVPYTAFVRILTNTVIFVVPGYPRDLNEYYERLKDAHITQVLVDSYFRLRSNLEGAERRGIRFITRGKRGSKIWISSKGYGARKLGERVFGNNWMRTKKRLFGKGRKRLYKKILLQLIGHNLRAYERVTALEGLFVRHPLLEEAYLEL